LTEQDSASLVKARILRKYRRFGIVQEGETYLYYPYAYDMIDDCQKNGLAVTSIEGYFIETGDINGRIGSTFDASSITADNWDNYRDTCNQKARAWLDTLITNPRLMFRLTLISKEDWKI
jgi:hypothetical protein